MSGFPSDVGEFFAFLGCFSAEVVSWLSTFRDRLHPIFKDQTIQEGFFPSTMSLDCFTLQDLPTCCPEPRQTATDIHSFKKLDERRPWFCSSTSSVICQTTGPKLLPKRFLHIVRSRASSFNWQYPVLSLSLFPEESSHMYMVSLFLERDYPGKVIMW